MQFPKLTPLQSRFAASLLASVILLIIYFSLTKPPFAYAAELDERIPPDHNHPIILDLEEDLDFGTNEIINLPSDESMDNEMSKNVIRQAPIDPTALANNDPKQINIKPGETQFWVFNKDALSGPLSPPTPDLPSLVERTEQLEGRQDLRKRQDNNASGGLRSLWITLNTCLQPSTNNSEIGVPPQLQLYISESQNQKNPGPGGSGDNQRSVPVENGYSSVKLDASDDVFIGVAAVNTSDFTGIWNYEIAGSIDAPFHNYDSGTPDLYFVDSDNHAALLITKDTTRALPNETIFQEWMSIAPPFGMFAHNLNDPAVLGIQNSYCGLSKNAQIKTSADSQDTSMTARGGSPKEQFYIQNLNDSTTYFGFLAMNGNSTASGNRVVGGGGKVWKAMNFTTKTDGNCAVVFNLSFCDQVAYAVPSNPDKTPNDLTAIYDSNAATAYQFFNYSLQQIPCNTTATAQYSLARTCDDCAAAYKRWLCAVTIPRCEDYSRQAPYLHPRNTAQNFLNGSTFSSSQQDAQALLSATVTNSSRNSIIDDKIKPGPYKEILPCQDLCYDLVQSCPATLGFGCPLEGRGLNVSYGVKDPSGLITCSYLGAAYFMNGADTRTLTVTIKAWGALMAGLATWLLIQ
ncbi:MAG: hypothetical protein Q9160_001116 [Pyrenula sp. 1 TL-2023]